MRKGIKALQRLLTVAVAITYPDRLARFGFEAFRDFFKGFGVEILVLNGTEQKESEKELVDALIAILASFAGKLYSPSGCYYLLTLS